ncbi:MAG: hypothetical protein ACOYOV_14555 [Bacteroidales bacterium]
MITLDFKGPYHFDNLINAKGLDMPGIYIWGFTAKENADEYDIEDFTNPNLIKPDGKIDFKNEQLFIPYYVGIATGASGMTIKKRLEKHHLPLEDPGNKYTRLAKGYLKGIQSNTPLDKYIIKTLSLTTDDISYFNNKNYLQRNYKYQPIIYKNNYPINKQPPKISIFDSLNEFINEKKRNNFSFLYCPIENYKEVLNIKNENNLNCLFHHLHFNTNLSYLESFVFYSLKGITISKCHILSTVIKEIIPCLIKNNITSLIELSALGCNQIFKFTDAVSFKNGIPSDFPCNY